MKEIATKLRNRLSVKKDIKSLLLLNELMVEYSHNITENGNFFRRLFLNGNEKVLARGICPECKSEYTTYTHHDYYECNSCGQQWIN